MLFDTHHFHAIGGFGLPYVGHVDDRIGTRHRRFGAVEAGRGFHDGIVTAGVCKVYLVGFGDVLLNYA